MATTKLTALLILWQFTIASTLVLQSGSSLRTVRLRRTNAKDEKTTEAMDLNLEEMFEMFEEADQKVSTKDVEMSVTMSVALPWLPRPSGLDSFKLAGDRGLDPLNFAKNKDDLVKFRSAEIKHGRLAMLAAAGWPISELLDGAIAKQFGLPADLVGDGLAPSILNGGLGVISPIYWGIVLVSAAAIELTGLSLKPEAQATGDYGFDPLGLYGNDLKQKAERLEQEIIHGRLGMVAIVAYAAQEFASKLPVTKETPFLFEPIWTYLTKDLGSFDLSRGFYEIPAV